MAANKKKGLGKGLGALISAKETQNAAPAPGAPAGERLLHIDPQIIEPNPQQPRHIFDEEALAELAASITRDGVQEPVLVRQVDGRYELISGERRVRASIMAGIATVPAVCRDVSDRDMLRLGLIENIQREDLNAMETARAYQLLQQEFEWTQEEVAQEVGKKRATVANFLRLLNLPREVQLRVEEGAISMGHARALLALDSPEKQRALCRKIVEQGLSVRQVEKMTTNGGQAAARPAPAKDPNVAAIEDELRNRFGTRVHLRSNKKNRGKIEIEFFNLDELERLLELLKGAG